MTGASAMFGGLLGIALLGWLLFALIRRERY